MSNETPAEVMAHPIQPLEIDERGTLRFKKNAIVRHLLDHGGIDMNDLAVMDFSREDREQFAQLIGYSHGGAGELSYMSDEVWHAAQEEYENRGSERSLAAGKLAPYGWLEPETGNFVDHATKVAMPDDAATFTLAVYTSPPADPAKASEPVAVVVQAGSIKALDWPLGMVEFVLRADVGTKLYANAPPTKASGSAPDGMIDITTCAPPDGELVLVYTPDNGDGERYDFDYWEDGGWAIHAQNYDHYLSVGKGDMDCPIIGPSEEAPYTHWSRLPKPGKAATPPASAPEVTTEMVEMARQGYFDAVGGIVSFKGMRAALTAALQQEGKSHG